MPVFEVFFFCVHINSFFSQNQGTHFKLPVLVNAYITAWHKNRKTVEKNIILNEYISIIADHVTNECGQLDVILGIQVFFNKSFFIDTSTSPGKLNFYTLLVLK